MRPGLGTGAEGQKACRKNGVRYAGRDRPRRDEKGERRRQTVGHLFGLKGGAPGRGDAFSGVVEVPRSSMSDSHIVSYRTKGHAVAVMFCI